jgi:hypothetical protein
MTTFARIAMTTAAAGALLLGLSGCGTAVPKDQVASTIATKLSQQGVPIDGNAVSCPADLEAEVGKTISCDFTANGQAVNAVATVSSVDGSTVNFDIEAKPR